MLNGHCHIGNYPNWLVESKELVQLDALNEVDGKVIQFFANLFQEYGDNSFCGFG